MTSFSIKDHWFGLFAVTVLVLLYVGALAYFAGRHDWASPKPNGSCACGVGCKCGYHSFPLRQPNPKGAVGDTKETGEVSSGAFR